jgi:hypothetical protein
MVAEVRPGYVPSVPLSARGSAVPVVRSGGGAARPERAVAVLVAGDVVKVPAVAQLDPEARAVVLEVMDVRFTQWPGVVELSGVNRATGVAGLTLWVRLAQVVRMWPPLETAS